MPTPQVSVVMATMRADSYLAKAVTSVLNQTFADLELILVLDGVPRASVHVDNDPRIVFVELPRRIGVAAAANAGVRMARSEFIARIDADDIAHETRLARQLAHFDEHPEAVLVGSSATLIDPSDKTIGHLRMESAEVASILLRRNALVHSTTMYRRSAFDDAGGYDERCTVMEDYELWLRMAVHGQLDNIPDELQSYRLHEGQISRRTPPWTPGVPLILHGRRRLSRHLGQRRSVQWLNDTAWVAAQFLRHFGLRSPAYTAGLTATPTTS